jgi:hypothetical protein
MARRSLPSASSRTDPPLRLVDVDIVEEAEDVSASTRIDGDDVATLLDVTTETNRLLNPEDISLELEHVADLLAALADNAPPPTSGALTVAEHCLRRLAARVDALRPGARTRAQRFVITPGVREMLRDYTVRWALLLPKTPNVSHPPASSTKGAISMTISTAPNAVPHGVR